MAKKLLKTNRKTAATMPSVVDFWELVPANTAILAAWPAAPKSMSERRPKRSMVKTATQDAMKYSVPLYKRQELVDVSRKMSWSFDQEPCGHSLECSKQAAEETGKADALFENCCSVVGNWMICFSKDEQCEVTVVGAAH